MKCPGEEIQMMATSVPRLSWNATEIRSIVESSMAVRRYAIRLMDHEGDVASRMSHDLWTILTRSEPPLREYCGKTPAGQWLMEEIGVGYLAVALMSELRPGTFPSAQDVWQVCGLGNTKEYTAARAEKAVLKAFRHPVAVNDLSSEHDFEDALEKLSLSSGRSRRRINGYPNRVMLRDVVDWLVRRPYSRYLSEVCDGVGQAFQDADSESLRNKQYWAFREQIEQENQAGVYAAWCQQYLTTNRVRLEEREFYERGRLPQSHVELRARKNVTREMLREYFEGFLCHERTV